VPSDFYKDQRHYRKNTDYGKDNNHHFYSYYNSLLIIIPLTKRSSNIKAMLFLYWVTQNFQSSNLTLNLLFMGFSTLFSLASYEMNNIMLIAGSTVSGIRSLVLFAHRMTLQLFRASQF
jgi:hypothetical protein